MIKHKLFLGVAFSAFIFFCSCTSNDDGDITGTYTILSVGVDQCDEPLVNMTFDFSSNGGCSTQSGIEICGSGRLIMSPDNTYNLSLTVSVNGDSETMTIQGTYMLEGNMITICEGGDCDTANYLFEDGKITLRFPDGSCTLIVTGQK